MNRNDTDVLSRHSGPHGKLLAAASSLALSATLAVSLLFSPAKLPAQIQQPPCYTGWWCYNMGFGCDDPSTCPTGGSSCTCNCTWTPFWGFYCGYNE